MTDINLINKCEEKLKPYFSKVEEIALFNQEKVLKAFQKNKIALRHFVGTSGYGYGDEGRDTLNRLVADIFKAEEAVCAQVVNPRVGRFWGGDDILAVGVVKISEFHIKYSFRKNYLQGYYTLIFAACLHFFLFIV